MECLGDRYPELKSDISELIYRYILDRYIPVGRHTALPDLTLIKLTSARFVGTGDFLIRYEIKMSPVKEVL
jgi:hypothetical protein